VDAPDAPGQTKSAKPPLPEFPGDPGAPATNAPAANAPAGRPALPAYPGDPDAGAASSSSSSSSSSAGGDPDSPEPGPGPLADAGSSGDNTKAPARRKKLPKVNPETPESRAAEDLTVADFYQKDGNYLGAYTRAKDAVQYQPNDPYAHFALAEAARKLGKKDEAKEQYAEVLKLDPIPKQLKETQRALAELAASR
jgi:tetratricopeptide (TPR) repeat protein